MQGYAAATDATARSDVSLFKLGRFVCFWVQLDRLKALAGPVDFIPLVKAFSA